MYHNLQVGRAGLDAFQKKIDMISNNISNVQTTGYNKGEVHFEDLLYDQLNKKGIPISEDVNEKELVSGLGIKTKKMIKDFQQGILQKSSNPLDLAIEGEGFFGVKNGNGDVLLTRNGSFSLSSDGYMVDQLGNTVMMEPPGAFSNTSIQQIKIDGLGNITSVSSNGKEMKLGKMILYNVSDKSSLGSAGNGYYALEDKQMLMNSKDSQNGFGDIKQGYLEGSNVDIGKELVEMLVTQRSYQINTKSIHAADEMWSMINNIRR